MLPFGPPVLRRLSAADPALGRLIRRVGPCRLEPRPAEPFRALSEAVVYQQLTGKAAATILGRVVALYAPRKYPTPQDLLKTPDSRLRGAGLSGGKARALKDLAAKTLDGTVPALRKLEAMGDGEIVERLTEVHGVGAWTVQMMLIFRMGRPDVLPTGDYGVRKGFARTFRGKALPTPAELEARGERWRPFRSAASWYLWRSLELP